MKDILIINFKRHGDIFQMGRLISSLKYKHPDSNISILINKEFETSAQTLGGIKQIFTLDRKRIVSYKKNKIYSDGFALDEFGKTIKEINKGWNLVINYSNDRISTSLTSYLAKEYKGIKFDTHCNVNYSNEWSIVFNDILTQQKYTPINFNDTYHKMCCLKENNSFNSLNVSNEYNKVCHQNFLKMRKSESKNNPKIIGLQLTASNLSKMIERSELIKLINELNNRVDTIPLLLIAPTSEERNFANKINSELDKKAVTIEAPFTALPSVLINCDILVTPDTAIKHVADILDVPLIELSMGPSPFLKQGTVNPESIIMTPRLKDRDFTYTASVHTEKQVRSNEVIKANDIIYGLEKYYLGFTDAKLENKEISVYRPENDEVGTFYKNIEGRFDAEIEISRYLSRDFILRKVERKSLSSHGIIESNLNFTSSWLEQTQGELIKSSRHVLAAIKTALAKDSQKLNEKLLEMNRYIASASDYCSLPFLFYKAKISNIDNPTIEEIENTLIGLKNDLQIQFEQVKEVSNLIRENRSKIRTESAKDFIHESRSE
ncbi:glycosyltransferase family 9 protein [Halobacteriovorax sp. DPLXC-1]|uniref:glycosyltransferase family 9 protein n=1 Tax=Halobacteriovorax sp. DPLXC-1 TaxID=3110771 RepID=UPI002FF334AC